MFKVIVLVCNLAIPRAECTEQTAIQHLESPEFKNELECQVNSQPWLAKLAVKPNPEKEYPKIICPRIKRG